MEVQANVSEGVNLEQVSKLEKFKIQPLKCYVKPLFKPLIVIGKYDNLTDFVKDIHSYAEIDVSNHGESDSDIEPGRDTDDSMEPWMSQAVNNQTDSTVLDENTNLDVAYSMNDSLCTSRSNRLRFYDLNESFVKHRRRKFFCEVEFCRSSFLHRGTFIRHMNIHKLQGLLCRICFKVFESSRDLHAHQKQMHSGKSFRLFACKHCDRLFASAMYRDRHYRRYNYTGKFIICKICSKTFNDRTDYLVHSQNHSEERPFPCHECGMHFKRDCQLMEHVKTHFPVEMFPCDVCGEEFRRNSNLKRHKFVHRQTAFTCSHCHAGFRYQSSLTRHTNRVHRKVVQEAAKEGTKLKLMGNFSY